MAEVPSPCPFCEIVAGRGQAEVKYVVEYGKHPVKTKDMVIVPLNPVTPGHVIIIPSEHVEDFSTDTDVTARIMSLAGTYAQFNEGDFNLITSKGEAATQTVFHLHVHLVPRFEGDGLRLPWTDQEKRERLRAMADAPSLSGLVRMPPMTQEQWDAIPERRTEQ